MIYQLKQIKEYCGVFGINCSDFSYSVSGLIYSGLMALQHRGQIFSGIALTTGDRKIVSYKGKGLVSKVLNPNKLKTITGNVGIGHVCYGRPNCISIEDAQPYHFIGHKLEFSIALNGTILNYDEIYENLRKMGRIITGKSDIELLTILIEAFSNFSENILDVLKKVMNLIEGAYSILVLSNDGSIYALRDKIGYKPLCYGKLKIEKKEFLIVCSESCAIDAIGGEFIDDVKPGELIHINLVEGIKTYQILAHTNCGVCQFEYVYFARPDSIIDGISVWNVRYNLGRKLAQHDDYSSDNAIVVPVPDSGRSAAMGYAWESGVPYEEGLMKNRYLWQLKSNVNEKLNPIKTVVKGKDIILIDDSILSGNTMKKIIKMLRIAGAKSIHVRISCPPIIKNCDLNDSISNRDLLIAYQTKVESYDNFYEEMRRYIGADSLTYQTIESLIEAIGIDEDQICTDCLKEYCLVKKERENLKIEHIP